MAVGCDAPVSLDAARKAQEAGQAEVALEMFRELMETRPDDPEVNYRYGLALIATGKGGVAVWPLKKAMQAEEWKREAGLLLAGALTTNGAHDDAIEICDLLLEDDPDDVNALGMRATARIASRRDYVGALADADRVLELDPDNEPILTQRAAALLGLGMEEEAAEALEALDLHYRDESLGLPGSPAICAVLATFAKEKGETELAESRFEGCLDEFPDAPVVVQEAIKFFDGAGRPDRSRALIEGALASTPENYILRWSLATRLDAEGREDEALEVMKAGTELDSPQQQFESWVNLAGFYVGKGRFEDGVAAYEQAVALAATPDLSPDLSFAYADALILADRYEEALALADTMELEPHRELVRGRIYLLRGEPEKALGHLHEGLRLWPDNAVARYYAAAAAEQLGDFESAIEDYRYAMRSDPQATDANLRLARIHDAQGEEDLAMAVLAHTPNGSPRELDVAMMHLELLARRGQVARAPAALTALMAPRERWALAAVAIARGVERRAGVEKALAALENQRKLDLSDPLDAPALSATLELLHQAGRSEEAVAAARTRVEAAPDQAVFQALLGQALARTGVDRKAAVEAYERALAIDAEQAIALYGLARLLEEGDAARAEDLFARAIAADPDARDPMLSQARFLIAQGRTREAEDRLEALLREFPADSDALMLLVELRLDRGARDDRTRELAERAVRFRGGAPAEALRDRARAAVELGSAAAAPPS